MSITNELRGWASQWRRVHLSDNGNMSIGPIDTDDPTPTVESIILGMANRIDFLHAHEMTMARGEAIEYLESNASDRYIKLPVDADGVPIHIGDEMEGVDKYDSLKKVMGKVITVSFESDGIVDVAIRAWNSDGKSWHRAYLDQNASVYRHHHEPTVEDVLREFANKVCCSDHLVKDGTFIGLEDTNLLAEYANRLRLVGDE